MLKVGKSFGKPVSRISNELFLRESTSVVACKKNEKFCSENGDTSEEDFKVSFGVCWKQKKIMS